MADRHLASDWKVVGTPQQLTYDSTFEESASVSWGAGGVVRIAFSSVSNTTAIYCLFINADGARVIGEPQLLTSKAIGSTKASISRGGNGVRILATGRARGLGQGSENEKRDHSDWQWHCEVLSYSFVGWVPGEFRGESLVDVYVMPSTGGAADMVCEGWDEVTDWSQDGKRIIGNTVDGRAWMLGVPSWHRSDLLRDGHWNPTNYFSVDNRWFTIEDHGAGYDRVYIQTLARVPVRDNAWIIISDLFTAVWSLNGNVLYGPSGRDVHRCIWAQ